MELVLVLHPRRSESLHRFRIRLQANCLKNFFPSEWHREHQIVYVKADLLKIAGRVPGGVAI